MMDSTHPLSVELIDPNEVFEDGVAEQLGHYVYVLIHPDTKLPIYVGKGKHGRVFQHRKAARLPRIKRLLEQGRQPEHLILRHGLKSQEEALAIEAAVIDAYRLAGIEVDNSIRGHGVFTGSATVKEINHRFGPKEDVLFDKPTALYRFNRFDPNWSDDEVFKKIRCCWPAGERARKDLQYACAVSDYVVVAVYRIDPSSWEEQPGKRVLWQFDRLPIAQDDAARAWLRAHVKRLFINEEGRNKARVRMLYVGFPGGRQ